MLHLITCHGWIMPRMRSSCLTWIKPFLNTIKVHYCECLVWATLFYTCTDQFETLSWSVDVHVVYTVCHFIQQFLDKSTPVKRIYSNTVKLQWLENRWSIYNGWIKLVFKSIGNSANTCCSSEKPFVLFEIDFVFTLKSNPFGMFWWHLVEM